MANNLLNQSTLFCELGVSSGNLKNWKKGRVPNGRILKQIANYFNVSSDYLMDNEDILHSTDEIECALLFEIKGMDKDTKNDILNYAKYRKQQKLQNIP